MNFCEVLNENIKNMGYIKPTPVQEKVIPLIKKGTDIITISKTGSGKTACFTLPILDKLIKETIPDKIIKVLILEPTRELAMQTRETIMNFRKNTNFKCSVIIGGTNRYKQKHILKRGFEILVATPGRLKESNDINLEHVDTLVLDEADLLLDMGFISEIDTIIKKLPKKHQTLLFSATTNELVMKLTKKYMIDPVLVKMDLKKNKVNEEIIITDNKFKSLLNIIDKNSKTILFVNTKINTNLLYEKLKKKNINVNILHGDMSNEERITSLNQFKDVVNLLITTDLASRGIDILKINTVINYDLPQKDEVYVHRIGRTARNDLVGNAISICTKNDIGRIKKLEKYLNYEIKKIRIK